MNINSISYEYLLKARQMSWENAEVIEYFFGPVPLEQESERVENRHRTLHRDTIEKCYNEDSLAVKRYHQHMVEKIEEKMYVYLDYNKVIKAQILLSDIDADEHIARNISWDKFSKQPTARCGGARTSKDSHSTVASSPEHSEGEKQKACTICVKTFKHKSHLTAHLRTHTGEKPFSCPQCEKKFSVKSSLRRHLLIYSGVKEYSCDICRKTFAQKSQLRDHSRTHTGDKPFKCTTCNAMFSQRGNLDVHMRTHTGETPYQCQICEKKFNRLHHLQTHVRVHTKEKPYACPTCNKTFSHSSSCKRHVNKCHSMPCNEKCFF